MPPLCASLREMPVSWQTVLTPTAMNWLTSLTLDSIGSWEQLKKVFTDNYMATCTRLGTKHDLNRIYQKPSELLHSYIRQFSEMRISIPTSRKQKSSPPSFEDSITATSAPNSIVSRQRGLVR